MGVSINKKRLSFDVVSKYQEVLSSSLDGFVIVDEKKRIIEANKAFLKIVGLRGDNLSKFGFLKTDFDFEELKNRPVSTKTRTSLEREDGSKVDVEMSVKYDNKAGFYIVFVKKFFGKDEYVEKLKKNEFKYKSLVEKAFEGVAVINDKRIRYVNNAFSEIVGLPKDKILNKSFISFIEKSERQKIEGAREVFWSGQTPLNNVETMIRHSDGKAVSVEVNAAALNYEGVKSALLFVKDVSHLVENEKRIIEAKEKAETYLDIAGVIIIALDREGNITLVNRMGCNVLGYSKEELIGRNWFDCCLAADNSKEDVKRYFKQIISGKVIQMENFENKIISKKGELRTISWHNRLLRDKNGKIIGTLSSGEDVTKFKELDKVKDEFISVASHQLKTPLTSINWYTESMIKGDVGKMSDKQIEYLEEILKGGTRMANLVSDLLKASEMSHGNIKIIPRNVSLKNSILKVIKEIEPLAKNKKVRLSIKLSDVEKVKIPLDPELIHQVFFTIISNSVSYMKFGRKGVVEVSAKAEDDKYVISFKDNGMGIPKEVQPRIFEKFFRAENAIRTNIVGTGLGLFLVKAIMDASGGRVYFKSNSKGTSFYVELPKRGMQRKRNFYFITNNN